MSEPATGGGDGAEGGGDAGGLGGLGGGSGGDKVPGDKGGLGGGLGSKPGGKLGGRLGGDGGGGGPFVQITLKTFTGFGTVIQSLNTPLTQDEYALPQLLRSGATGYPSPFGHVQNANATEPPAGVTIFWNGKFGGDGGGDGGGGGGGAFGGVCDVAHSTEFPAIGTGDVRHGPIIPLLQSSNGGQIPSVTLATT